MPSNTQQLGELGETIAAQWLMKQHHRVVDRNYRKRWGEVDLITLKDSMIYFVEVKTVRRRIKNDNSFRTEKYRPAENVHTAKVKRLHRAAQTWLAENNAKDSRWQIDLITARIDISAKKANINRIECIS